MEKHRPVMIHRTVLGSMERFIGILTEHFGALSPCGSPRAGAHPDHHRGAARHAESSEGRNGKSRAALLELDLRNEKIGFKVQATNC